MLADNATFNCDPTFYNSLGACYYFGVSFLDVVGYFTSTTSPPWWSNETIPDGPKLCKDITASIKSQGIIGPEATAALSRLTADCP